MTHRDRAEEIRHTIRKINEALDERGLTIRPAFTTDGTLELHVFDHWACIAVPIGDELGVKQREAG